MALSAKTAWGETATVLNQCSFSSLLPQGLLTFYLEWLAPFHLSTAGIKGISLECTPCPLHLKQYLPACTSPCENVKLPVAFKCEFSDRWNWFLFSGTRLYFQCPEQCRVHSRCSTDILVRVIWLNTDLTQYGVSYVEMLTPEQFCLFSHIYFWMFSLSVVSLDTLSI